MVGNVNGYFSLTSLNPVSFSLSDSVCRGNTNKGIVLCRRKQLDSNLFLERNRADTFYTLLWVNRNCCIADGSLLFSFLCKGKMKKDVLQNLAQNLVHKSSPSWVVCAMEHSAMQCVRENVHKSSPRGLQGGDKVVFQWMSLFFSK